jgi:hypothetical protein
MAKVGSAASGFVRDRCYPGGVGATARLVVDWGEDFKDRALREASERFLEA